MALAYKRSTLEDKKVFVNKLFSNISRNYDLLNNLMSFGMHSSWKKQAVLLALKEKPNPKDCLDLCSGTADLAILINKLLPNTNITCIDNCKEMLDIARSKIESSRLKNLSLLYMDFEDISPSSSFDLITIGFGLRNLTTQEKSLKKIFETLRTSGVFACIDLGHIKNKIWKNIFYSYFFNIVPKLGKIFSGNEDAYEYLVNSLTTWHTQEELKELILKTGFRKCYFKNIFGGAVAIHIAIK